MLYFIPAWYQENKWCENEQYWYARRMRTEFDDTVKHIQLFHRSKVYPFKIMLLSFAPNFRHFLHRQSVFHAPYWSCFDSIQEIRRKKVMMFSFHNLNWPENIEFIYSPFVLIAQHHGKKYAQVEFGEDGNLIQIDMFQNEKVQRRNVYDDRGFVSSTIVYEDEKPIYQDYLTDKGVWKIRHFFIDNHIEVNPKSDTYLLEYQGDEYIKKFSKVSYAGMEEVIFEVLSSYLELGDSRDMFCVAMHELHAELLKRALNGKKVILSFFEDRYQINNCLNDLDMIENADYIITDSQENMKKIKKCVGKTLSNITDITPFDSRVDFGISQQLSVQKILVPVDGMKEDRFEELICYLGQYLTTNHNAQVHLFTRVADYDRKKNLLELTRRSLATAGLNEEWALDDNGSNVSENRLDMMELSQIKFFVEQCVDELSVSKCMREQRLIVDMREKTELYLQITAISMGIPQIVHSDTQFVEHGKNGIILRDMERLADVIEYYLDSLTNWNEAMVYSYELGKNYTTKVLVDEWKEVINFAGHDSSITTGK